MHSLNLECPCSLRHETKVKSRKIKSVKCKIETAPNVAPRVWCSTPEHFNSLELF